MGLPDWRRSGRIPPWNIRESRASHWELKAPDFRTLIAAENASFFLEILGDPVSVSKWLRNEASLAVISSQNMGLPDWRLLGLNIRRAPRKSRTTHWELKVPGFRILIADTNAFFVEIFGRPVLGAKGPRKMRHPYPRLGARMWVSQIGGRLVAISPGSSGNRGPILGN